VSGADRVDREARRLTREAALGDADGGAPLHSRVREAIRRQVRNGELVDASGRLMTEAELVKHFGVSRITVRSAIQPLVAEGVFLARARARHLSALQWARALGGTPPGLLGGDQACRAGARRAHSCGKGSQTGTTTRCERRWASAPCSSCGACGSPTGAPVAIEHAFYPPDIGVELEARDLTAIVMYRVFEEDLGLDIEHATQTIGAALAGEDDAALLGVSVGSALIALERLTASSTGRPLEFLRSVYLPDYFRFTIELTRRAR
jgi:GntR family transcriptional regulator